MVRVTKKSIYFWLIGFCLLFTGCSNSNSVEVVEESSGKQSEPVDSYWPTEEWRTTSAESVGMDSSKLVEMFEHVDSENIPMEGFLVIRNGYIVAENYGGEFDQDKPHPIYSVTKSLTSALTGVAIQKGALNSVEEKVMTYIPKENIESMNPHKENVTIKHFLTMSSGLDFTEQTQKGFYESETWEAFMKGNDPAIYILNRPLRENIDEWNYSTGDARVVSRVLQEATGKPLSDFAEESLFEPLGIENVEWPTDRSGTSFGGTGVLMTPRDMARLGYLYLNDGEWEGEQLFPKGWVEESTKAHVSTGGNFDGDDYGYYFWLKEVNGHDTFRGMGLYGQYLVMVPDLNLLVVQTSSGMDVDPLLENYILPSVKADGPIEANESSASELKEMMK
ncbi:serine hydrolase domain-containing protein [Alkalihalobacillus sp. CinArs1]|uniref:serine hydrolase domain-containing protein n=1 Tax=Alkalihalobacillus sp. CinArs1 TaxID=2995314 RepID=UPI0022DD330D|nr:serine hydrolase [Alkalihalobacillus sp. CinArs1]